MHGHQLHHPLNLCKRLTIAVIPDQGSLSRVGHSIHDDQLIKKGIDGTTELIATNLTCAGTQHKWSIISTCVCVSI